MKHFLLRPEYNFDPQQTVNTGYWPNVLIFYLLVFLLLVSIAFLGRQLRIAFEIIKSIRHSIS